MTYVQPLLAFFLAIATLGLIGWRIKALRRTAGLGLVCLFLLTWQPAAWLFSRPLECRYPVERVPKEPAEAIVVLSSTVSAPEYGRDYPVPDKATYERCEYAAFLYKHWRSVPVLASGGSSGPNQPVVAAAMRELLLRAGIPESAIRTEELSHSTYTNALYTGKLLTQMGIRRITLVVDAQSMPRAAACFQKLGFTVIPAPSSFVQVRNAEDLIPSWKAVVHNEITLHEIIGLVWYRVRQWI